jgi:hypothetical protein
MFRFTRLAQRLLLPALLFGTVAAWAQVPPTDPPAQTPQAREKGNRSTLPESVRRVERETGGEVLRAEPMQRDGREVHRLKVMTADGRVRVVQEDPNNPSSRERPARGKDKQKTSSDESDEDPSQ